MAIITVNVEREKQEFIINCISSKVINEKTICKYCIFYSGIKCHGHGDFWGTCSVYTKVNPNSSCYANIVYDNTKCKVFSYLNSLDSERKGVK